jgi:hypothetical protein
MAARHEHVFTPILESWPFVPVEQDANLKHLLEDPDYWLDAEPPPPARTARRKVAPVIIPGKHGGWRPGGGAPKGNLHALKTGAHTQRLVEAVRLAHTVDDLKALVYECARQTQTKDSRARYRRALTLAWMASLQDEETANALRALLVQGIARAAIRLGLATPEMTEHAKISPQNNQTTKTADELNVGTKL